MTSFARLELLGVGGAGAFVAVAVLFAAAVAALALRPDDRRPVAALCVLLATVAGGYVVTRLAAIPPLDPERESFDTLGICTSAIEVFGLVLAVHIQTPHTRLR